MKPTEIRDAGALQSALERPKTASYYTQSDLISQSATLAAGISQAHAFIDGNKRTAYMALDVFLRINGRLFRGDPIELANQLIAIADRADSLEAAIERFDRWLREYIVPL